MKKAMVNYFIRFFVKQSLKNIYFIWNLGKDAAGIALEAINFARDSAIDVVMIDTAGRMQDNEPLMRALSKVSVLDLYYTFNTVYFKNVS